MAASAQGLDVSNFQGRFSWSAAVKADGGLAFGIHRVTQGLGAGVNSPDPTASWNHGAIKDAGLRRGGYHFLDPRLSGAAQARYFADTWDKLGLAKTDMLWLDNEQAGTSTAATAGCAQAFMDELHTLLPHQPMGVYTFISFAREGNCAGLGRWPSWIAYPSASAPAEPPPWTRWTFWQWGQRNGTDADAFNGTTAQLDAWLASFAPAAPIAPAHGQAAGPVRHLTTGHTTLAELASARNTSPAHLFSMITSNYTPKDVGDLATLPLPEGTPFYTSN